MECKHLFKNLFYIGRRFLIFFVAADMNIIAYFSAFVHIFLHIFSFCMVGILKNPQLGGRGSFKYDLSDCFLPYFFSLLSGLKLCVLIVP